jgi:hypothetical protein
MAKSQIIPPDQFDIETDLSDLLQYGDRKVIAHWGKFHYDQLCDSVSAKHPAKSAVYEAAMFIYGTLFCENKDGAQDKEKARKVFNILYRLACQWGLIDDRPIDILKTAIESLKQITKEDIQRMSPDERSTILGYADLAERAASGIKTDIYIARNDEDGRRGAIELDGRGRGEATGARR